MEADRAIPLPSCLIPARPLAAVSGGIFCGDGWRLGCSMCRPMAGCSARDGEVTGTTMYH